MRRRAVVLSAAVLAVALVPLMRAWSSTDPLPYVAEFTPGRNDSVGQQFVLSPAFDPRGPTSFTSSLAWVNDGEYLAVITYGSGSCPTGPHSITVVGDQELAIGLGPLFPDRDVCTADLGPHVTVIAVPEGITSAKPLVAQLDDRQFTLPAASAN